MKPIKIFFAGEWGPRPEQGDLEIKNRLVSFLYPKQLDKWLALTKGKPGSIIIDSGAFSAWNKGMPVQLKDYMSFLHKSIERIEADGKSVKVVNLDVIPGEAGQTASLNAVVAHRDVLPSNSEVINTAAKQGLENLKIMKQEGLSPIHVYHQGEHIKWLDRMLKYTNYIGVSPANDMSNDSKKKWINHVFEYLYKHGIEVNTHGFAVMIPELLKNLPWTSCDSISWLMIAATGCVIYPVGGFKDPKFNVEKNKRPFNQILLSKKKVGKGMTGLTDTILDLFKRDGYTYDNLQDYKLREEINVRTYLLFEKWLNNYKITHQYKPLSKFF
jgi:hypothetical protein